MTMKVFASGEVLTAADLNEYGVNTKFAISTSNETAISNTTLHDDAQLFLTGLTAGVGVIYVVQLFFVYSTASTGNPDIKMGFTLPAGASFSAVPNGLDPTGDVASGASINNYHRADEWTTSSKALQAPNSAVNTVATPLMVLLMGASSGTLQFQWAQSASVAENTIRRANSFLWARRVA